MNSELKDDSNDLLHAGCTRRGLFRGTASLAAATAFGRQTFGARSAIGRPVLVQVFLRGAMDGLTTVVPHGDGDLYNLRPTLAVPPPSGGSGALDLDGFFGLAPAAAPLLTPWSDGRLAIVHASGANGPTRSHFDAFVNMELADASGVLKTGWMARMLDGLTAGPGVLRGVGVSPTMPLSLQRAPKSLAIPNLAQFRFPGLLATADERVAAITATYTHEPAPVGVAALDTLAALDLGGIDFGAYVPENGAVYPDTQLGRRLRHTAALIKGDIGVEAVSIDFDGWDLHADLGPLDGRMAALLDELTRSLEAFYLDLLAFGDKYVLLCMSEFGRRAYENASAGLDHGHGNAMFVMGHRVNGGQVYADWPGLSEDALDNGDLDITTDYRDIVGEVLSDVLGVTNLATVFPGYTPVFRGVTS
jgi:uncharacterized protein (DUF1501 family)